MLGYDANADFNRYNVDSHYRVWFSAKRQQLVVINVQDFDYDDYSVNGFVDYVAYATQADAQRGLALTLATLLAVARSN